MEWFHQFFLMGSIPTDAMYGYYSLPLVVLSYIVASMASYVALDMSAHLRLSDLPSIVRKEDKSTPPSGHSPRKRAHSSH